MLKDDIGSVYEKHPYGEKIDQTEEVQTEAEMS
jgi:hypothetical protein